MKSKIPMLLCPFRLEDVIDVLRTVQEEINRKCFGHCVCLDLRLYRTAYIDFMYCIL